VWSTTESAAVFSSLKILLLLEIKLFNFRKNVEMVDGESCIEWQVSESDHQFLDVVVSSFTYKIW
jgi:hypothetical protein